MPTEERVCVVFSGDQTGECHISSFTLPDPKTGRAQGYMLSGSQLLELQHFKCMYSSWFIGERLVADGGIYMGTPMDPLFILLPLLDKARGKTEDGPGVFRGLDQVLGDAGDQFSAGLSHIIPLAASSLPCVCDVRDIGGEQYYRLNDDRVLAWLRCKCDAATRSMGPQLTGLDAPSQAAYVAGFMAEYLSDSWSKRLCAALGVEEGASSQQGQGVRERPSPDGPPPEKKQRVDPREAVREAARKRAEEVRNAVRAKQAAGTKKISSFFAPKAAKS